MNLQLKKCTLEDFETLRNFAYETFYETFAPLNTAENMQMYLNTAFDDGKFRAELLQEQTSFYFAYADDALAGYMKLNEGLAQSDIQDNKSLEIERIYVSQAFQGKRVGQYLMEQAIRIAQERQKSYIWLGVWDQNEHAIRFYEKNGFYQFGAHAFMMGLEEQTDFMMRKDLK